MKINNQLEILEQLERFKGWVRPKKLTISKERLMIDYLINRGWDEKRARSEANRVYNRDKTGTLWYLIKYKRVERFRRREVERGYEYKITAEGREYLKRNTPLIDVIE